MATEDPRLPSADVELAHFELTLNGGDAALTIDAKRSTWASVSPGWLWVFAVGAFYSGWLTLVSDPSHWELVKQHWHMSVAMAFGSYAAGSTPMGGGTVAFPVLVLLSETSAQVGRDFSLAIQSVGMVSASLFILVRRQPLAWPMLRGALLGSLLGTPLGMLFVAPWVPESLVVMLFAVLWGSFGVLHLYRLSEITSLTRTQSSSPQLDFRIGLGVGVFAGSCLAAVTGVGIDMVLYTVLVLFSRLDLKVAIPTSVLIMAFNSLLGVLFNTLLGDWQPGVFGNWLAAAPVVALGAPLGAYAVSVIGRKPTLAVVAGLCVFQLIVSCYAQREKLGGWGIAAVVTALGICLLGLEWVRAIGRARSLPPQRQ